MLFRSAALGGALRGQVLAPRDHVHAERAPDPRHLPAEVAQADHAQRAPLQPDSQRRLPLPGACRRVLAWDVPRQCCGIHCHIDKSQLSALELGKLLVWLNHPDNREFIIKVAGRQPNSYTSFSSNLKVVDGRRLKNGRSEARYVALNVQANTAEFRIFRGTLNPEAFGKNLDFVEASVEWTSLGSGCSLQDIRVPAFIAFVKERRNRFPELWKHIVRWGYAPADKKQAR